MGFWDVTKRMIQGKPAFEAPPSPDEWSDNDEPTTDFSEERQAKREEVKSTNLVDEHGVKHIPVAELTNANYRLSGDRFELWATIRNQSDRSVVLDKVIIFGATAGVNYPLQPHDQRVFKIYSGPVLKHDNYHSADLYYKDELAGDYFQASHTVDYRYESDGTYEIVGFDLIEPIRDI